MTKSRQRWVFVAIVALAVALILLAVQCAGPRYRAYSRVSISPFTNAVLSASFHSQAFPTARDIKVEQIDATSMILIMAYAPSAREARSSATNATARFCAAVQQLYGGVPTVIDVAEAPARPYSFFREDLWPRLKRFANRVGVRI